MPIELYEDFVQFIQHPGQGFFSCCTVHLQGILKHFNQYKKIPKYIDSTQQFLWYKRPEEWDADIKSNYFEEKPEMEIPYKIPINVVNHEIEEQYCDYRTVNYQELKPFLVKYFTPSQEIKNRIQKIEQKYKIDYENTCVLFYRGNDKQREIALPDYGYYIQIAKQKYQENPNIRFLVQSDETEFLVAMSKEFPNNYLILHDEIRFMKRTNDTVDKVYRHLNPEMSKNYLAITCIMAKCKYVVCNSGNCSIWIAFYRGNAENITQFCYMI